MDYLELKVSVHSGAVDAVSEIYCEFGANGVSIEGPLEIIGQENLYWDYIDESKIGRNAESVVTAYYSCLEENLDRKIEAIKNRIRQLSDFGIHLGSATFSIRTVQQEDWENSWKQYFKPLNVTDRIVIKPQWEEYETKENQLVIEIDPGMAFGTGSHETTSMCLLELEKYIQPENTLLDIGTGSGILSIAAALLGARKAVGVDLDPVAVEVARQNVMLNRVSDQAEIIHGDLVSTISGQYDIVVANIIAEAILLLLDSGVRQFVRESGLFICSGIIEDKEQMIVSKLEERGFEIKDIIRKGEWLCIVSAVRHG